eukprot:UC4_evm11s293
MEAGDARPNMIAKDFPNRAAAVEAVKIYYLKFHDKHMMQDRARTGGRSTVLICEQATRQGSLCKACVRISRRNMLVELKCMRTAVRSDPNISGKSMAIQLQAHDSIVAGKRMLYRVKSQFGGDNDIDFLKLFNLLEPWVQEVESSFPRGS